METGRKHYFPLDFFSKRRSLYDVFFFRKKFKPSKGRPLILCIFGKNRRKFTVPIINNSSFEKSKLKLLKNQKETFFECFEHHQVVF